MAGNQQRCCILGVCCPPPEQRIQMKAWLLSNLHRDLGLHASQTEPIVEQWMAELFTAEEP